MERSREDERYNFILITFYRFEPAGSKAHIGRGSHVKSLRDHVAQVLVMGWLYKHGSIPAVLMV